MSNSWNVLRAQIDGNTQSLCSPISWKFEVYHTRRYYKARYMLWQLCLPVRQSVCLLVAVVNRVKNTILSKYRGDRYVDPSLTVRWDMTRTTVIKQSFEPFKARSFCQSLKFFEPLRSFVILLLFLPRCM